MRWIPAPARLAPEVLGVVVVRAAQSATLPLPAHALAVLTVVLRGALRAPEGSLLSAGQAVGSGSAREVTRFAADPGLVCASLLCRASVLPRLTGEPAHVFTDALVPADVFGRVPWEVADSSPTDAAIAAALFAMIELRLRRAAAPRRGALRLAQALPAWAGLRAPWDGVRPPEGWSERQWLRDCRDELGVPPKLLQRLARLHASVRLQSACPAAWGEHALDAGFADQAHLARDYRLLAGLRPRDAITLPSAGAGLRLGAAELAPRFFTG